MSGSVIANLDRQISRAIERGRGIGLSQEQLDILVAVGAIDQLKDAAADDLRRVARERGEHRRRQDELLGSASKAEQAQGVRMATERLKAERQVDRRSLDELLSHHIAQKAVPPPQKG